MSARVHPNSRKKEKKIRFAGEIKKMPVDIHTRLVRFADARRYPTLFDACLYLIHEALTLHEICGNDLDILGHKGPQTDTLAKAG